MVRYFDFRGIVQQSLFRGGGAGCVSMPMITSTERFGEKRAHDVIGIRSPHEHRGLKMSRFYHLLDNLQVEESDVEVLHRGYGGDYDVISTAVARREWSRDLRPAMNWWLAWVNGIQMDFQVRPSGFSLPAGNATTGDLAEDVVTESFLVLVFPPIIELDEEVPSFVGRDW